MDGQTDRHDDANSCFQNFVNVPKDGAFHTVTMHFISNVLKIICSRRKLKCNTKYLQCSLPGCNVKQCDAYLPNHSTLQHSTILIAVRTSCPIKHMSHQSALISKDTVSFFTQHLLECISKCICTLRNFMPSGSV